MKERMPKRMRVRLLKMSFDRLGMCCAVEGFDEVMTVLVLRVVVYLSLRRKELLWRLGYFVGLIHAKTLSFQFPLLSQPPL